MLSDRVAIELVEKCVRYHIFASFNLARLHLSGFDQTMNTENLQKSLQSLRHMYTDIGRMAGGQCANEAEFRSYDIILNLTDPNVHSQAITYRDEVRLSAEVRLALSLATSFQSNNYVRFFRELKTNGSYLQVGLPHVYSPLSRLFKRFPLQCCLSYRYFTTVRCNAFKAIALAYRMYPLDKFTQLLAFDSDRESTHFLELLEVDIDLGSNFIQIHPKGAGYVTRTRESIIDEGTTPECLWLRERRSGQSIPEVLCRGRRPSRRAVLKPVVNSFDAHGRYVKDPVVKAILGGAEEGVTRDERMPVNEEPRGGFQTSAVTPPQQPIAEREDQQEKSQPLPPPPSSFSFAAPSVPKPSLLFGQSPSFASFASPFQSSQPIAAREESEDQLARAATARREAEEAQLELKRRAEQEERDRLREEEKRRRAAEEAERIHQEQLERVQREAEEQSRLAELERRRVEESHRREEEEKVRLEEEARAAKLEGERRKRREQAELVNKLEDIRENLYKQWWVWSVRSIRIKLGPP